MKKDNKDLGSQAESASKLLVCQAMSLGTRYELLDLLDYAKQHNSDSIPVEHILEELQGLVKIDEESICESQISYIRSHQSHVLHSIRENPSHSGLYLVRGDLHRYPFLLLAYFNSDNSNWSSSGIKDFDFLKEFKISHWMECPEM